MKKFAVALQIGGLCLAVFALGVVAAWLGCLFGGMAAFAIGAKLESEVE